MTAVAENRNVQRALSMMERDLKRAAIEYQTYRARRGRLEELQNAHRTFSAGVFPKPASVMPVGATHVAAERRAA